MDMLYLYMCTYAEETDCCGAVCTVGTILPQRACLPALKGSPRIPRTNLCLSRRLPTKSITHFWSILAGSAARRGASQAVGEGAWSALGSHSLSAAGPLPRTVDTLCTVVNDGTQVEKISQDLYSRTGQGGTATYCVPTCKSSNPRPTSG